MSGYRVVIETIAGAGQAATRVADGVRVAGCAGAVPAGEAGVPGAGAVSKLAQVTEVLTSREHGCGGRLDVLAASLATAADRYAGREDAARAELSVPVPVPSGRVPV